MVLVLHCGPADDAFEPGARGGQLLSDFVRHPEDLGVAKALNDPFHGTDLKVFLDGFSLGHLLYAGWATDFCAGSTVRSAVSNGYEIVVVADGHTVADRLHLDAAAVICHHNRVWRNLIAARPDKAVPADDLP